MSTASHTKTSLAATSGRMVVLTISSEIHIKSAKTRSRFIQILCDNLRAGLEARTPETRVIGQWDRVYLVGGDPVEAASLAADTPGVMRAEIVERQPCASLEALIRLVADTYRERIRGRTFAVRIKRRGRHAWQSVDAERQIGSALVAASGGVDLNNPEVTVRAHVHDDAAYVVIDAVDGPDGLPIGVSGRGLALLSGGFDSSVAAWLMMRRGMRVDFVHFLMDCAQSEQALAVAAELCRRWGHGRHALCHVVDFQPIKTALTREVRQRLRQVVLKQLMTCAADRLAAQECMQVLVSGDAVGQVSSQTIDHLVAVDRYTERPLLRPLAGFTKQEIIGWSRRIGTLELSARAQEVCDLADGPVATAAKRRDLERAHAALPAHLVDAALAERQVVVVEDWVPGAPLIPVTRQPPAGVPVRAAGATPLPDQGPIALRGRRAPFVASRLAKAGRQVWVIRG